MQTSMADFQATLSLLAILQQPSVLTRHWRTLADTVSTVGALWLPHGFCQPRPSSSHCPAASQLSC